jgi:hypothetical protein
MATIEQTAIDPATMRVRFWAAATVLAPPLVALAVWAVSTATGVMGDYFADVTSPTTPIRAFVIGAYIGGPIAALLYGWGEWNAALGHASKAWPTATARIAESRVAEKGTYVKTMRTGTRYRLKVEYRYRVQGAEYLSRRVQFGDKWLDDEDFVRELAAKYPAGAEVTVHYNPKNPSSAVLDASDEVVAELESDYRALAYACAATPVISFVTYWLKQLF